jgi:hypothetical protein
MGTTIGLPTPLDLSLSAKRFPLLPPMCCAIFLMLFAIAHLLEVIGSLYIQIYLLKGSWQRTV